MRKSKNKGNDSQIGHRECINDDINRTVKSCLAKFRKRQMRRQKFLKQYKPKASMQPVINNEGSVFFVLKKVDNIGVSKRTRSS